MRVASLLPSATELVCALGAEEALVGISHECDFPEEIRDRAVLTSSRIDPTASSRAIDAAVREVVSGALSVYDVNAEQLEALRPDVVVTQDLCEVCAVSLADVERALSRLVDHPAKIVSLRPTRLEHVFDDVQKVADALGLSERGRVVRAELESRVEAIRNRTAGLARRRVATVEWVDPLMLGGTWMPQLIELAGGVAVGASTGDPAPTLTPEQLLELRPDVVLVKPCGFTLVRAEAERPAVDRWGLDAEVVYTDGNAYFNRPGPRLVESLEILAAVLHPEPFADFAVQHADVIRRSAAAPVC